jgi:AcrR family transcriptional regulator
MAPRPNVSEERKTQILNAAEAVLTKKGVDEARMDDIAAETGLSKGTLYLYFKHKEDLILAILDRIFQREFRDMEQLLTREESAREILLQFAEFAIRDLQAMTSLTPLTYEFLGMAFRNRVVQKAFRRYFQRFMNILVPIVERGIRRGEFRAVDPQKAAIALGAVMEGTMLLAVYDRTIVDPAVHIRSGMHLLLHGLQKT